jgi:hypothetical protein
MTENKSRLPPEESREPLSATGMFRLAFEAKDEETARALPADAAAPGFSPEPAAGREDAPPAKVAASSRSGEFTRLFQQVRPDAPPLNGSEPAMQAPASTPTEPGEFTRIFLGRSGSRHSESGKTGNETGNPGGARGFSSHGPSESAVAEGSVTQLFRAPSATPPARIPPVASRVSTPIAQPSTSTAKDQGLFGDHEPAPATPRITNLLESLSMAEPYAIDSVGPEGTGTPVFPRAEAGGVTQFLQKLAEEPNAPSAGPAEPAPPPVKSGPGEYTRVVERMAEKTEASVATPPAGSTPALSGRPPAPAIPHLPAVPAPPPIKAPSLPQLVPPTLPTALPQKRSRLEAIAPVLLALNTALLVAVLLLLVLLLRSR